MLLCTNTHCDQNKQTSSGWGFLLSFHNRSMKISPFCWLLLYPRTHVPLLLLLHGSRTYGYAARRQTGCSFHRGKLLHGALMDPSPKTISLTSRGGASRTVNKPSQCDSLILLIETLSDMSFNQVKVKKYVNDTIYIYSLYSKNCPVSVFHVC